MTLRALAKALRRRQLRAKLASSALIHATPDAALVTCYTHCAKCAQGVLADERAAVRHAATPEEFVALCNMGLAAHQCPADHAAKN